MYRAAALLIALFFSACTPMDDALAAIFKRSMRSQPSFDPYEQAPLLPPEGSVPLSAGNYGPGPHEFGLGQAEGSSELPPPFTQEDMAANPTVVDTMVNPVAPTEASLRRGEILYNRTCVVCHGPDGSGATSYLFEVFPLVQAYPLRGEAAVQRSDGYIYGIIRVGRAVMPAYGHQIGHYDRWHVVNYVRQLQAGSEEPSG